jgi:hypothetical protein
MRALARRKQRNGTNGHRFAQRLFGESFYENLGALMDEQIAEIMKDPEFRRMLDEFNLRMFEIMARIAREQMAQRK